MAKAAELIKSSRTLQVALIVLIVAALVGLSRWQKKTVDTVSQSGPSSVPALLKLQSVSSVKAGETLEVEVLLDTKAGSINTVTANFDYPADRLEFEEVRVEDSFIKIWFDKRSDEGRVLLTGALPRPGFAGRGKVATVVFKVKGEGGLVQLSFDDQVSVFENGTNKNVLGGAEGTEVSVST